MPTVINSVINTSVEKEKDDNLALCWIFSSDVSAHIAQSVLEEYGIPSIIDNQIFSSVFPIGFNSIGGLRLMVYEKDLEWAQFILEAHGLKN